MDELLQRVKARIDNDLSVSDETLNYILEDVIDIVLADTNQTKLNSQLDKAVVLLSVIEVNRLGSEGLTSESFSGVSTSYQNDYPESVKRILNANRKLGTWEEESES